MSLFGLGEALREDPGPQPQADVLARSTAPLEHIFEEEPVPLDVFIADKKFLYNPPLSPVQYEAVRYIERIYYPELYPFMAKDMHPYWGDPIRMVNFITLQWGKGSGKDHICRMASLRIAYLLQCLRDPQEYYEMPSQDTIHMLNVASSSPQAMQAFFIPITRAVKKGWFADKCDPKPGIGLVSWAKNVEMVSGHADAESQEGLNLILGIADEIDAFKTKDAFMRNNQGREPTKSAEGILKMIRTSAATRFPRTFKNVRISYPRYLGSTIQKLTEQGRKDNERNGAVSRHYVSGPLPTWEVNPRVTGKEAFAEDYEEDPDMAEAMYECRPKRAVDTYFRNMDAIRQCVTTPEQPIHLEYKLTHVKSEVTGETVAIWDPVFTFLDSFKPMQGARYAIHADLAIKADRAGVAMSHVSKWVEETVESLDEEGGIVRKQEMRPVVKTDFIFSFQAEPQAIPVREIQIRWVRMLAFELIRRGFAIQLVTYDGFQSTDSMQILNTHGIATDKLSTDKDPDLWKSFRDLAYEGRLQMPFSQVVMLELESLGRFGGRVDHPPGGSKDEADALVCSVNDALTLGGVESDEVAYPSSTTFATGGQVELEGYDDPYVPDFTDLPIGFAI